MSRFYVTPDSVRGDRINVGREESRHIADVMRLKSGEGVVAFDGTGMQYECVIESAGRGGVILRVDKAYRCEPPSAVPRITLVQAIPKKEKMEMIVQKATELGVAEIVPAVSARTVVRAGRDNGEVRVSRWERIAVSAAKQCGRTTIPKIVAVMRLKDAMDLSGEYGLAIIPCLHEKRISLRGAMPAGKPSGAVVFIGPEGGFTQDEIDYARGRGIIAVSLGDLVLKSDTAAIAVLSMINFHYTHS